MKRNYDADPAWSRTNTAKQKKRKMVSRASLRLLSSLIRKKRTADRGKVKTVCATRTVEFPSTQTIGQEKSKLLFMLAIGLFPNSDKKRRGGGDPLVSIERLDPTVEAMARVRTREVLHEIFVKRTELESYRRFRLACDNKNALPPVSVIVHHTPRAASSSESDNDNVELVDLVSEDEESSTNSLNDDEIEIPVDPSLYPGMFRTSLRRPQISNVRSNGFEKGYKIITSSPHLRKPVFKPLINNQDSGKIFQNWKPESMTRLMNLKEKEATNNRNTSCISSLKGSKSKLLSSLKSLPLPSVTTLTLRKFTSSVSTGGSCKSHVHGAREDTSSSTSGVSDLDYIVPDNVITLD